jgi:2-polyprenyl-6-methoxyphenol hydroxylase-like FAD-dependent oxidoreductase
MKVLVIGGGIGGFATALSLHAIGIECEVFEHRAAFVSSASASTRSHTRLRNWQNSVSWRRSIASRFAPLS